MRKILMVAALMLGFCSSALAGEMHTPPIAPDPQPNSAQEQSSDTNTSATNSLIQAVLEVIVSVLP